MSYSKWEVFDKCLAFKVGEGSDICFWSDDRVGVGPECRLFPRVFRVVPNKESSVKACYCWVGDNVSWDVGVRRALCQSESVVESSF